MVIFHSYVKLPEGRLFYGLFSFSPIYGHLRLSGGQEGAVWSYGYPHSQPDPRNHPTIIWEWGSPCSKPLDFGVPIFGHHMKSTGWRQHGISRLPCPQPLPGWIWQETREVDTCEKKVLAGWPDVAINDWELHWDQGDGSMTRRPRIIRRCPSHAICYPWGHVETPSEGQELVGSLSSSMVCRRYQGYAGYVLEFGMEPSNSFLKHGGLEVLMMMMMTTTTTTMMMMMTTTTTMMMTTTTAMAMTITRYSVRRWSQFYPKKIVVPCCSTVCRSTATLAEVIPQLPVFFPPVINHGKQGHPQHLWEIHRTKWRNLQHTMGHSWGKPKRKPTRDGNQSTGYESTILNYHS